VNALELTRKLIRDCLQLQVSVPLTRETPLLGGFAEFNSLTIATLIIEIEEVVDCEIADDEFRSEIFETIGTLADFVDMKMAHV
jgi:acyl carrier protein